jgi:hypothetical protein
MSNVVQAHNAKAQSVWNSAGGRYDEISRTSPTPSSSRSCACCLRRESASSIWRLGPDGAHRRAGLLRREGRRQSGCRRVIGKTRSGSGRWPKGRVHATLHAGEP